MSRQIEQQEEARETREPWERETYWVVLKDGDPVRDMGGYPNLYPGQADAENVAKAAGGIVRESRPGERGAMGEPTVMDARKDPIRVDDLVVMTLTMNPPSGRKRRIYAGVGLSCRRVGKGIYRVRWEEGILLPGVGARRFGIFPILVQISSPWSEEKISVVSRRVLGAVTYVDDEEASKPAEEIFEIAEACQWMPLISVSNDAASADVMIYEIPKLSRARLASKNLKKVLHWQSKHTALSDRAGFCLMTYRRGGVPPEVRQT